MSVKDAIYRMCHNSPGGVEALAVRMKLAAKTLYAMANPNDPTHGWPLSRWFEAMHFTGDTGPLEEACVEFGGIFLKMPDTGDKSVGELYRDLARLSSEFGDVPRCIEGALKDGHLKPKEFEKIKREGMQLNQAMAAVLKRLEDMVEHPPGEKGRA